MERKYWKAKAEYHTEKNPYAGNPFVEALPPMKEEPETRSAATINYPKFTDEDKALSATRRKAILLSWVDEIFIPFKWNDKAHEMLEILIRQTYMGWTRENFQKKQIEMTNAIKNADAEDNDKNFGFFKASPCYILSGFPGVGKTTAFNSFLKDYPTCIEHSGADWCDGQITQVPYIWIQCPMGSGYRGSLYSRILTELDKSIGKEPENYSGKKLDYLEEQCKLRLANQFVGAILIEESDNILSSSGKTIDDFLKNLFNITPCSVFLIGGIDNQKFFDRKIFGGRRVTKSGDYVVRNFAREDPDWKRFCTAVWNALQITRTPTPYSEELHEAMYGLTHGFPFLFVELYVEVQAVAMKASEDETILPEHIPMAIGETKQRISDRLAKLQDASPVEVLKEPEFFSGKLKTGESMKTDPKQLKKEPLKRAIIEQYKLRDYQYTYCSLDKLRKIADEYLDGIDLSQPKEVILDGALSYFKDWIEKDKENLPPVGDIGDIDLDDYRLGRESVEA